jgi:hypothetical protein
MITKSFARSNISGGDPPSQTIPIEFEELCVLCEKPIPHGRVVLRKSENNNIICLLCIVEIAEVK